MKKLIALVIAAAALTTACAPTLAVLQAETPATSRRAVDPAPRGSEDPPVAVQVAFRL